ncbi:hypothetical protein COOONC_19710 [Cooperia oncophora]
MRRTHPFGWQYLTLLLMTPNVVCTAKVVLVATATYLLGQVPFLDYILPGLLTIFLPWPDHSQLTLRTMRLYVLLKESKIRAVFNLEESGEHSFCGSGNLVGGFSYDPERLMRNESWSPSARKSDIHG